MTSSAPEPSVAPVLPDLSAQAGDVHLLVTTNLMCLWSSDGSVRPGVALADAFAAEDADAVTALLATLPAGPVWARLRSAEDGPRWVGVLVGAAPGRRLAAAAARVPPARPDGARAAPGGGSRDGRPRARPQRGGVAAVGDARAPARRSRSPSCDLDDFAFVNEDYGREAGDEILRIVTGRISDALRSGDLVARLEDDQLLVVLRGVHHLRGAIRVANKIRAAVEDPIVMPFGEIVQTVSVGVTLISRGESVDSVLERAEGAMAMAKEAGRNTVMSSPPI